MVPEGAAFSVVDTMDIITHTSPVVKRILEKKKTLDGKSDASILTPKQYLIRQYFDPSQILIRLVMQSYHINVQRMVMYLH